MQIYIQIFSKFPSLHCPTQIEATNLENPKFKDHVLELTEGPGPLRKNQIFIWKSIFQMHNLKKSGWFSDPTPLRKLKRKKSKHWKELAGGVPKKLRGFSQFIQDWFRINMAILEGGVFPPWTGDEG